MKCNKCGAENPKGSVFCKKCGNMFEEEDPEKEVRATVRTVKCPKCGHENVIGSAFCKECGTKLSEEKTVNADEVKKTVRRLKTKAMSLPRSVMACFGAAFVIILILIIVGINNASTINLNDYLTFKSSGYDGYGKVTAVIDWNKIEERYKSKVRFTLSAQKELGQMSQAVSPFSYLEDNISVNINNNKNLKNGDTVNYTWYVSDELNKYVKVKLKYKDGSFMVRDLEKLDTTNVFEDLQVAFSGIAPMGRASLEYVGNDLNSEYFSIENKEGLSNGDTVVVKLDERATEYLAEREGKIPLKMSEEYTVSGLDSYLVSKNDINESEWEPLINQGYDVFRSNAAKWNENTTILEGCDYIGSIILSPKINNEVNQVYLVYRIKVHEKYNNDEKSFDEHTTYYWYVKYNKVLVGEDGKISCDINAYSRPSDSFEIDSGISSGWFSNYTWKYYGYDSIPSLRRHVIDMNLDAYVPEDNLNVDAESTAAPTAEETAPAENPAEEKTEKTLGTITSKVNHLNIRSIASKQGDAVGQLSEGDRRTAYEKKESEGYTWYRIGENEWIADGNGDWVSLED